MLPRGSERSRIRIKVFWLTGFLAARMRGCPDAWMILGCSDAWLLGCVNARMLGYLDDWMLELATRMLGCVADWMLGYPDAGVGCPDAWLIGCADAWLTGCLAARVPDWMLSPLTRPHPCAASLHRCSDRSLDYSSYLVLAQMFGGSDAGCSADRMLGCLATWMRGCRSWLPGCSDAWMTGCLDARMPVLDARMTG